MPKGSKRLSILVSIKESTRGRSVIKLVHIDLVLLDNLTVNVTNETGVNVHDSSNFLDVCLVG